MGRDKLPLKIGDAALLDRVHSALASRCEEILIVGDGGHVPAGARRISDLRSNRQGPLAGIEAGLFAARHRSIFVAAGDMPFLSVDLIGYLLEHLEVRGVSAVVPRHRGGTHPLCAAYDREVLPRVRAALDGGVRSMRGFLEDVGSVEYVEDELRRFGDPDLYLMNVNSPEDLGRARAVCGDPP